MLRCTAADLTDCLRDPETIASELPVELVGRIEVASLQDEAMTMIVEAADLRVSDRRVVPGPVLFTVVDTAGWLLTIAHFWPLKLAVTTDLSMQFLRPASPGRLVVTATALRIGRRCVIDVSIDAGHEAGLAAHAVATFAPMTAMAPGRGRTS